MPGWRCPRPVSGEHDVHRVLVDGPKVVGNVVVQQTHAARNGTAVGLLRQWHSGQHHDLHLLPLQFENHRALLRLLGHDPWMHFVPSCRNVPAQEKVQRRIIDEHDVVPGVADEHAAGTRRNSLDKPEHVFLRGRRSVARGELARGDAGDVGLEWRCAPSRHGIQRDESR